MTSIIKVDQIQTAAGGVPTAADLGLNVSGSVVQTVTSGDVTAQLVVQTINTWFDTSFSVTITPTSANSKVLILHSTGSILNNTAYFGRRLLRGSLEVAKHWQYHNAATWGGADSTFIFLDSPSTTLATTYKIQAQITQSGGDLRYGYTGPNNTISQIIAMEIAG